MSISPIDLRHCEDLEALSELVGVLGKCGDPHDFLLVGAMARDVLLHYAHGIKVDRATLDADFALAVKDWKDFESLSNELLRDRQFSKDSNRLQRFQYQRSLRVDIIPFGGVENPDRKVEWPTDGGTVLDVLGYREAMATSLKVILPGNQTLAVVSLPALAILKIVAWNYRHRAEPLKDADDLWLILKNYLEAGNWERLNEEAEHLLAEDDFDLDRAGAWLLGCDARKVLMTGVDPAFSISRIDSILKPQIASKIPSLLPVEMWRPQPELALQLLAAFHSGLTGRTKP
ncbi:MAG: nucleotidyl transferase AbiEii/AbiGii toxin family protein [Candidatus Omnitrophica bacterium]|nr:nucleotidyl transferase AbiEii/AbiGii toxin family protein [Candidatus Omnitrophota bacterium]